MLKLEKFLFIRKLLVLGVLLGGLFLALSNNQTNTSATPCCSTCDDPYYECVAYCNATYPNNSSLRLQCIRQECQPPWFSCHYYQGDCDPGC
jgi:hypothetical protein